MNRWALVGAILAMSALMACQISDPGDSRFVYDSVAVTNLVVPDTAAAGSEIPIIIEGYLPTPAWDLHRVEVEQESRRVTLRPVGRLDRDREPVIQIIVDFSDTVRVRLEEPGTYDIQAVGRNKTLTRQVVVE